VPKPLVNYSVADGLATVELNRPHRRNAVTGPLLDELADAVNAAGADDSVQAMLLCGAGGAFCSGLDLGEYNADPPPEWLATSSRSAEAAHNALAGCPVPIVVALERYAINGGAAYALAGDVLITGETAWLQVGEMIQGLPAPMNLAWLSTRHSQAVAARIVYTGERIAGPALLAMSVAHSVVPDDEVRVAAQALAERIAASPAGSTRTAKAAMRALYSNDPVDQIRIAREAAPVRGDFRPTQAPQN
jgi:enoyl-CoA hydratase/carnithine racemase